VEPYRRSAGHGPRLREQQLAFVACERVEYQLVSSHLATNLQRIGQKVGRIIRFSCGADSSVIHQRDVEVYRLVAAGCMEEIIYTRQIVSPFFPTDLFRPINFD
jgi:hypothetical protein